MQWNVYFLIPTHKTFSADGFFLIGGSFNSYNQIGRNNIARLQNTGSGLAVNDNEIYKTQIFPNPSTGIFNININQSTENATLKITDLNGRIVHLSKAQNLNNHQVDLNGLQNGIYLLNIENTQLNQSYKLVKQW